MEQASSLLEYGVIGLIAFLAISVAVFFYLKIEKLRTEKEDYIIKSNDYKESLLEKTLTPRDFLGGNPKRARAESQAGGAASEAGRRVDSEARGVRFDVHLSSASDTFPYPSFS